MKVLVIEDNKTNMKLTVELLKMEDYVVLQAEDADSGMAIARQELPDLILMDIQLPGTDGLTATRLLKADEKTKHIKIIALTAFAMKGDMEKIKAAGCDEYISKPIRYKAFLDTVKSVLGNKDSHKLN